jgi:hypothetical protein
MRGRIFVERIPAKGLHASPCCGGMRGSRFRDKAADTQRAGHQGGTFQAIPASEAAAVREGVAGALRARRPGPVPQRQAPHGPPIRRICREIRRIGGSNHPRRVIGAGRSVTPRGEGLQAEQGGHALLARVDGGPNRVPHQSSPFGRCRYPWCADPPSRGDEAPFDCSALPGHGTSPKCVGSR